MSLDTLEPNHTFLLPAGDRPMNFLSIQDPYIFAGGDYDNHLYVLEDGFFEPILAIDLPDGPKSSLVIGEQTLILGGWNYL